MKRLAIVFLFLFLLSGCVQESSDVVTPDQLIGKTISQAGKILDLDENLVINGYAFATDDSGNPVVLEWETKNNKKIITNSTIYEISKVDNSPESFDSLEYGMNIYQVVEKVGIPTGIPALGILYLEFTDSEGNSLWLPWSADLIYLKGTLLR